MPHLAHERGSMQHQQQGGHSHVAGQVEGGAGCPGGGQLGARGGQRLQHIHTKGAADLQSAKGALHLVSHAHQNISASHCSMIAQQVVPGDAPSNLQSLAPMHSRCQPIRALPTLSLSSSAVYSTLSFSSSWVRSCAAQKQCANRSGAHAFKPTKRGAARTWTTTHHSSAQPTFAQHAPTNAWSE